MAPSGSHLHKLVVRNYKLLKAAWKTASANFQYRVTGLRYSPIPVRASQPLHPIAALKQSRSRFNSSSRHYTTSSRAASGSAKSSWPTSATRTAVASLPGRAPFASSLRPNLTGGALPRSAGGYGLGSGRIGGQRYFSHGPAAPAQVVQSVSQAVRAFLLGGQKAQFDGTNPRTGAKSYRTVSVLQDSASRKIRSLPQATPGSYIDFRVNPTITALTPLSAVAGFAGFSSTEDAKHENELAHLNAAGLLDVLSIDFSRALKDLAAILNDLKALSGLGDLPITYRNEKNASILRVHFPGCDSDTVEGLCTELGVKRGVVVQDPDFDAFAGTEVALLFPFAPSVGAPSEPSADETWPMKQRADDLWYDALFPPTASLEPEPHEDSEAYSTQSETGLDPLDDETLDLDRPLSSPRGDDSLRSESRNHSAASERLSLNGSDPLEYRDFEGIYRFIELCDDCRR